MKKLHQVMMVLSMLGPGMLHAQSLERLMLIDAASNAEIKEMRSSGDTIDLALHPLISFRAVTSPEPLGSGQCVFNLSYPSGAAYTHSEGTPVYACFGDNSGDYLDWESGLGSPPAIEEGSYSLTVTPGSGNPSTFSFVLMQSEDPGPGPGTGEDVPFDTLKVADAEVKLSGELKQWHNIIFNLGGPAVTEDGDPNPFSDYLMEVSFSQGDTSLVIPGYFAADGNARHTHADSGNVWRAHFRPPSTGAWTYRVSFRTGTDVAVSEEDLPGSALTPYDGISGILEVAASDKTGRDLRGKGRLSYIGERYLRFAGDSIWFLKAGADSPENFLAYEGFDNTPDNGGRRKNWAAHEMDWQPGDPLWADSQGKGIIGAVNYLSSRGMNVFSFLTMAAPQGDDKNVFMWTSTADFNRFDCSKLDQWELVFNHAETRGMYLHFKTSETENEVMLDNGDVGRHRKLYYRELIARYAHHLALNWNLGEENGNYGDVNQNDEQRRAMAAYFHENDPYKNLIVIHTAPGDYEKIYRPLLGDQSELTGVSIQTGWKDVHAETAKWVAESALAGKQWVVANDEQNPHTIGVAEDGFTGSPGPDDIRAHVLWGNFMAGGAGVEYYFGYERPESDLTCQDWRSRSQSWGYAKVALDFFNQYLPFWEMRSADELTSSGYCFAKEGEVYAVYLEQGGAADVELAEGTYDVMWYNPRTGGSMGKGPEGLEGGASVSIGYAPTTEDWVALVREKGFSHKGNGAALYPCGDTIVLTSFNDFPEYALEGYAPAYKDVDRGVLAINAEQYKGVFAAAATLFEGSSGFFNVTITTLTETDGESSYRLLVDSVEVGAFTNPETDTDYRPATHTWENIEIHAGDELRLEFSSHTNGKIPEGNSTAYSRGRWKQLALTPLCSEACLEGDAFQEEDGYVVIEMESTELNASWSLHSGHNSLGEGFIQYDGANTYGSVIDASTLSYKVQINNPGTYQFLWRTRRGLTAPAFDQQNDSWLKIEADDFYGMKNGTRVDCNEHFIKVWIQTDEFSWNCWGEHGVNGFEIYAVFDNPGEYLIQVSGRSQYHIIDRMTLFQTPMREVATSNDTPESPLVCGGYAPPPPPYVALEDMFLAYDTVHMIAGESYLLRSRILPEDATDQEILWRSAAAGVVSVNEDGLITAHRKGKVRINAATKVGEIRDYATVIVHPDQQRAQLDKAAWSVIYVDSEDSEQAGGLKENAIDGDPNTFWHTQWFSAQPALPHEIQIDLGKEDSLDILEYWPRQDEWGPDGTIASYELYMSHDAEDWGEPLLKDHFRWAERATQEDYKEKRRVFLDSTARGRFLRFVALSEVQDNPEKPFTAIAELDLWAYTGAAVGLSEVGAAQRSTAFPNPFGEQLQLIHLEDMMSLSMVRADGRLVQQAELHGQDRVVLSTAALEGGLYFIRLNSKDGRTVVLKVQKQD